MLLLRGVLAFVFGLLCFASPGVTLRRLVILFGSYTFIDGLLAIAAAITRAKTQERWWSTLIEGLVGSMIGVLISDLAGHYGARTTIPDSDLDHPHRYVQDSGGNPFAETHHRRVAPPP